MPARRPRHQITETPEVADAINQDARRWPGEPRSKLLIRLVREGARSLEPESERDRREQAITATSGKDADAFRIGRGDEMRQDLADIGVQLADHDADGPLRLAELRVSTRLKLPDCCVLDVALSGHPTTPATVRVTQATFDRDVARAAISRGVLVAPEATDT